MTKKEEKPKYIVHPINFYSDSEIYGYSILDYLKDILFICASFFIPVIVGYILIQLLLR